MIPIDPNALYTRDELIAPDLMGPGAFDKAQAAGLYAVGNRYLGRKIIDCLAVAHEIVADQHAAKNGIDNEETKMATHSQGTRNAPAPGPRRSKDLLRELD